MGKRSGKGFVAHKAMLVSALSRALSDRVTLMDFTIGRRGFVGYLKALGGSNIVNIVALPVQPAVAAPGDIYVPGDYPTIQGGINAAVVGDTVHVAADTYNENITLKSGVIVQGAGAGVTTIDGGGSGTVVTANSVGSTARLDGFTITNGAASYGAGIYFQWSSPTISNCIITNNSASYSGGGIELKFSSSPTISNCTITDNSSSFYGGGGVEAGWSSHPIITDSIISGNSAIYWGGGIDVYHLANPTISNCIISDNNAGNGGGGINIGDASPTIINSTITGNSANKGGGIYIDVSNLTVSNSIISDNDSGGIYAWRFVYPTFNYNDVWGNSFYDYYGTSAGPNDISIDPLFENPTTDDYHLQPSSTCIDAGDNTAVPSWLTTDFEGDPRIWDGDSNTVEVVDMGADEYFISNLPPQADADGPYSGVEGLPIELDGSGSSDPEGGIVLYEWDFDNDSVYDYSSATPAATYPPNNAGTYEVTLRVTDDGGLTDTDSTPVIVLTPAEAVEDTLEFIDEAVIAGDLEGEGNGTSADGRLGAIINMIEKAKNLIASGDIEQAINQLEATYKKCDGDPKPPDFVTGYAAAELAAMIQDIIASLSD